MTYLYLFLAVCAVNIAYSLAVEDRTDISVRYDTTTRMYNVELNSIDTNYDAYGYYYKNYNSSGWNHLDVFMNPNVKSIDEHVQFSRSMGYLEGYVSCQEIKTFWPNYYSEQFGDDIPGNQTIGFIKANYDWMLINAKLYASTDDYWYRILTSLEQLHGLYHGYVAGCGSSSVENTVDIPNIWATLDHATLEHFLLINAWGDLFQITGKFVEAGYQSKYRGSKKHLKSSLGKVEDLKLIERCSAIVKLLPDNSDVVFGHATWDSYESLFPRIIKHYSFPIMKEGSIVDQFEVYFSSSPALLTSVDDLYTIQSHTTNLGVLETSNDIFDEELLQSIRADTMLSWMRILASNQLASSGYNWAERFSRYQSGTYANQWMVLDYNLFQSGVVPPAGFFTVFEEVPGVVHFADQTQFLIDQTYWPSYNVPFYEDIFELSGYAALCQVNSDNCYNTAPRAYLFKEYHDKITSVEGGEWILSHNDWQHDSASKKDACNAIACRGDLELNPLHRGPFGALDIKVTSVKSAAVTTSNVTPKIYARLGPTQQEQPVFCWINVEDASNYSHNGHPDCFDFAVQVFPPQ